MNFRVWALGALLVAPSVVHAAAPVTPPQPAVSPARYTGSLDGIGGVEGEGTYSSPGETLSMGGSPSAYLSASATGAGDHDVNGTVYYYYHVFSSSIFNDVVPVSLDYVLRVNTTKGGSSVDVGAHAGVGLSAFNDGQSAQIDSPDDTYANSASGTLHAHTLTDREGTIYLNVSAITRRGPEVSSAYAFADPYLYIDQSFLDAHPGIDFTVRVSPGVTNAEGAVPEPATWATMVLGFGLAGGLLRRRARMGARAAFA